MDVWSPDRQADPLERIKKIGRGKGVTNNHRRHPGRSKEISVFLLTFLIMDVPGFPATYNFKGVPYVRPRIHPSTFIYLKFEINSRPYFFSSLRTKSGSMLRTNASMPLSDFFCSGVNFPLIA